jgi:hypothetical protein
MRNTKIFAAALCLSASALPATAAHAATLLTFEDIPEGTVAAGQYTGLTFTGGSVLTQGSALNPPFPPQSPPNVLYNYLNDTIGITFSTLVDSISGYVTGNRAITLSAFNGATLLGSVSTSGANYTGVGTPNALLSLAFPVITSVTFSGVGGGSNTFTLDDVTVGGTIINNSGVPEPATWAMMLIGFGAIGLATRRRRQQNVMVSYA